MVVAVNPVQVAWVGTREGDTKTSLAFIGSEGKQTLSLDVPFAEVVLILRGAVKA